MFPVKVISDVNPTIDSIFIDIKYNDKVKKAKRLDNQTLFDLARESESLVISKRPTTSTTFERNAYISEYAKRRADGVCQLCGQAAPFQGKDGQPYLETHHIKWLSEGGSDTIDNTVALCPNCHRKMHVLNIETDRAILMEKAKIVLSLE